MNIKELAERVGFLPGTVINWELRGMKPKKREEKEKLEGFIDFPYKYFLIKCYLF